MKKDNTVFVVNSEDLSPGQITFTTDSEILKLCENGDIFVRGKLIENDKEVVDALREFLNSTGFLK